MKIRSLLLIATLGAASASILLYAKTSQPAPTAGAALADDCCVAIEGVTALSADDCCAPLVTTAAAK